MKDKTAKAFLVVIETPKGSRNKYSFDKKKKVFKLTKVLPLGTAFPFDFGFIPGTLGGDGDPVDILVMMDEPAFPGCAVACRVVGAIKAEQKQKDGEVVGNDRIIAVAEESLIHKEVKDLADLPQNVMDEIEHFFISYNEQEGKEFKALARLHAADAIKLIRKSKK